MYWLFLTEYQFYYLKKKNETSGKVKMIIFWNVTQFCMLDRYRVAEGHTASILISFTLQCRQRFHSKQWNLSTIFTLKMEVARDSDMFISTHKTTRCNITEDHSLQMQQYRTCTHWRDFYFYRKMLSKMKRSSPLYLIQCKAMCHKLCTVTP